MEIRRLPYDMTAMITSMEPQVDEPIGVYVHWPFCLSKCPYCDFNSHVRESVDHARWRAALLRELDHFAEETAGRPITSIFFGGGTPSLMQPDTVAALIEHIRSTWPTEGDLEITLEANPTSVEAERFAGFAEAGVNRVSLGVQSLDDEALRFLGRHHSAREALEAVEIARRHFRRYSFDLIYGLPDQSVAGWGDELRRALRHVGEHVSAYQLTIEPGTVFHARHRRGAFDLPSDDDAGSLYEETQRVLREAGLPAYEISNHARPGSECRHNLTYWSGGDWIGIGPGAHGRLCRFGDGGIERVERRQLRKPEQWLDSVEVGGHGTEAVEPVSAGAFAEEMLMMGLRLTAGIDETRFQRRTTRPVAEWVDADALRDLIAWGFLERVEGRLRATSSGLQRLNAVLSRLWR